MIVVSDTSPLTALLTVGTADILTKHQGSSAQDRRRVAPAISKQQAGGGTMLWARNLSVFDVNLANATTAIWSEDKTAGEPAAS